MEGIMVHPNHKYTSRNHWQNVFDVAGKNYVCGYCSAEPGSGKGWMTDASGGEAAVIRICPVCNAPTFFSSTGEQWPGAKAGAAVASLPPDVQAIHEEARQSIAANAPTGATMLCRKILMHVAVQKGADENQSFQTYVKWLIQERYAPIGAESWLDYIRERANEANHEIMVMSKEDSTAVLLFTEALMRNVYELPSLVPVKLPERTDGSDQETPAPEPEEQ